MRPFLLVLVFLLIIPISTVLAAQQTFPVLFDGETYDVIVDVESGSVDVIEAATDYISIVVVLVPNSGGSMIITIPRDLLDAKLADGTTDHILEVEADDVEIDSTETQTTDTHRTLEFNVLPNTQEVEIIGTRQGPPSNEPIVSNLALDTFDTHITVDDSLTLTGSLFTNDGEYITAAQINLFEDGVSVSTKISDALGKFSFSWSPSSDADMTLQVIYAGGIFTDGNTLLESSSNTFSIIVDPICSADEELVDGTCQLIPEPDTTKPVITVPDDITIETESTGVAVTYTVTASDDVDETITISCDPPSNYFFSVGTTMVNCTSTDSSGNSASASFNVTVSQIDVTVPFITIPDDMVIQSTSQDGVFVTYSINGIDDIDGRVPVECSPTSGSMLPIGTTTVICTAVDSSGNSATESFVVTVLEPKPAPTAEPTQPKAEGVPGWIKITAGFWVDGFSSDNEFVSAIEFLINEGVMVLPPTAYGGETSAEIPSWIQTTTGFWVDGFTSDEEFVSAIQWLIKNGIMKI